MGKRKLDGQSTMPALGKLPERDAQLLDPEFSEQLRKASKSGHEDERVEVLKRATELLLERNSSISRSLPTINLCTGFLIVDNDSEEVTKARVEVAIVHAKFLRALIKSSPKSGVRQHAVIAGFISDLFETLYRVRGSFQKDPLCDELEHRLKFLCEAALEDEGLKHDIPFIIANNLRAERRPSIAMLVCISGCNKEQIALLSTNLPTKEKQFFSQLLQRIEQK